MSDWKERLIQERDKLNGMLQKLHKFMEGDEWDDLYALPTVDRFLLVEQIDAMTAYLRVLDARISLNEVRK